MNPQHHDENARAGSRASGLPEPPGGARLDVRSALAGLLTVLIAVAVLLRGPFVHGPSSAPQITLEGRKRPENCLRCHGDVVGLGGAHAPQALGCSSCHLGDPLALDADTAHAGMVVLSGDLRTVTRTCGQPACHSSEAARVDHSVMAGAPGLLAVDRFAFGVRPTPQAREQDDLRSLEPDAASHDPAESHVRKLCASCHIGYPKTQRGDQGFESRGGGCIACHLAPPELTAPAQGRLHPAVSAEVAERRCRGCHARSGRISLSFHGQVELEPGDPRVTGSLPDGRPIGAAPADVHAAAGFSCIDCHTERGLMGDGRRVLHGYQAVDVRCEDCHGPERSQTVPSPDALRVARVLRGSWVARGRPSLDGTTPLVTQRGTPLWRTDAATNRQWLHGSGEVRSIEMTSDKPYHQMAGHERLSCQACHAQWAPRCTSCHTKYDPNGVQIDHLSNRETPGAWSERAGGNGYDQPVLAVGPEQTIVPYVEGMHLRIEGLAQPVERRLWAPLDPHTTGPSRTCASCHREDVEAVAPSDGATTRAGAALLGEEARARILRVSRCVSCHEEYEDPVYVDFADSVALLLRARAGDAGLLREHPGLRRCGGVKGQAPP